MALKKIGIVQDRAECYLCRDDKTLKPYHMIPGDEYKKKCEEDGLMCYLCDFCLEQVKNGFFRNGLISIAQRNWCMWNAKNEKDFRRKYSI